MTLLTIRLLGNPEATIGQQVLDFRTRKVFALLIYLLVEKGMHNRESLMTLLWPESTAKDAAVTLRVTLSRLRQSLQPAGPFLMTESGKVGFNFEQPFDLDLDWLATACAEPFSKLKTGSAEAAVSPQTPADELKPILELDRGEFLTGFSLPDTPDFDNWVTIQRQACQRQVETVYDRLTQHQLAHHESSTAVTTAVRWLTRAPFSEQAYRRLMTAQALAGDRPAALKTYDQCQTILLKEVGIEPAKETADLAKRIKTKAELGIKNYERKVPSSFIIQPSSLPFAGRADEHSQLVTAWHKVNQSGVHIVTVIGAAGVGKTRLVNAFQEWVSLDSPGVELWQGRAFEMGGRLSFQPIIEALRMRLEQENAPEDLLDDVWLAELSELMPELRARYPDLPPPMSGDGNFVRSRLFAAITTLGSALAARHPAVFVLDDMQWADADTLDMIHYMARHWAENSVPVLLLLTVRQENFAAEARLRKWITGVGRDVPLTRLLLDPLDGRAVQQLVAHLADPASNKKETDAFAEWLWAETHGLPFFIEALLQMLLEERILTAVQVNTPSGYDFAAALTQIRSTGQVAIPAGVREAILVRLERLSEATAALLLAAAVLGRACSFERLRQVADLGEAEALAAVEVLLNGRLLTENRAGKRPYMLAHDYIRELVYSESGEARRRIYHRRALIALEAEQAPAIECAFHALASRLDEPAFRFSLAAGDEALQNCAFQESLVHYDRAWAVARQLGGTAVIIPPQSWRQLYQKRGRALELANDYAAAQANYQEMLELAEERQDQALKLAALIAQCIIHATAYSPLFNTPKARKLGLAALDLAQKLADQEAEVQALRGLTSTELNGGGDKQQVLAYGEKALALARELGLQEQMGYMLGNLTLIYSGVEQFEAARKASSEAQSIWLALGNLPMLADVYTQKVGIFLFTGEYKAGLTWAHKALDLSQSIGNLWHQRMALLNIAHVHLIQGQFAQALANIEAFMTLSKEIDDMVAGYCSYCWIRFYLFGGMLEQAEHWANKLSTLRQGFIPWFQTFFLAEIARVKIARGKLDEGKAILEQAYAVFDREGRNAYGTVPLFVANAHMQLALKKPEHALEQMKTLTQRLDNTGSRYYLAEALWLKGKACLVLGRVGQARDALEAAKTVAEDTDERTILWQILATLIEIETTSNNEPEAEKLRQQAQEIITYIADHAGTAELRASFLASLQGFSVVS